MLLLFCLFCLLGVQLKYRVKEANERHTNNKATMGRKGKLEIWRVCVVLFLTI